MKGLLDFMKTVWFTIACTAIGWLAYGIGVWREHIIIYAGGTLLLCVAAHGATTMIEERMGK